MEKTAQGSLDVYDAKMNPVKNYVLPAKQFDKSMKQLNRFFKYLFKPFSTPFTFPRK